MDNLTEMKAEALAILSDPELSQDIRATFEGLGYRTIVTNTVGPARKLLDQDRFGIVLLDLLVLEEADERIGETIQKADDPPSLIVLGSANEIPSMRNLSPDVYVDFPLRNGELEEAIRRMSRTRPRPETEILGRSPAIEQIRQTVAQIAPTPVNVLITGESGTGKSLIAKEIHEHSTRSKGPFLTLNCGSLPETLLESELFGHEKGAFTDAGAQRRGLFETADDGTVFLDEIGEMSLPAQVRLLHVLEQREITRLGSSNPIGVNVRVIAATNRNLQQAVTEGSFRRDLYYRLRVVEIEAPALRTLPEDIPLFTKNFIRIISREHGAPPIALDRGAMSVLQSYAWPGNIRELRNLIERLMVLSVDRDITANNLAEYLKDFGIQQPNGTTSLPVYLGKTPEESSRDLLYWAILEVARDIKELKTFLLDGAGAQVPGPLPPLPIFHPEQTPIEQGTEIEFSETGIGSQNLIKPMNEVERDAILGALQASDGHRKKAARLLGMAERTLYRKIRQYGL
ncbi:MAG: sigma-54 dependent transcriptional regulator [Candidatus Latescibacterota bacterium]|nr:sigma-54 dependent transcriptional regulator [Candidatus Latescibacterota bacterium]